MPHPLNPNAPIDQTAHPPGAPIRIACVGDSITAGSGTSAPPGASNAYPAQLQRMLETTAPRRFAVGNFGISGATTLRNGDKPYRAQLEYAASREFKPDVVVLMLGTNDTKPHNWKFKDEFSEDLRSLLAVCASLDTPPRIFVCRPCFVPAPGNFGINEPAVQEELPLIDAVVREAQVGLIDIHAATMDRNDLFPDNVHPSNKGAEVLASTIYRVLMGMEYRGACPILAPQGSALPQ